MATVVDELVVQFGLDASKFNDGQKAAMENLQKLQVQSQKSGKEVEASTQKTIEYFETVKRGALMVGAAVFGGTAGKAAIDFITNLDASTGRLSKTMNMSAEELSTWQGAVKRVGGSAESITSTIQGLSSAMNQFMLTGQGPFTGILSHLELSMFDKNGKMKTSADMLLEIADAVQRLNAADPARAAATLSMIPGMNQDSINLLINGRRKTEELLEASRRAGTTTRESAAAAQEYQKAMADMDQSTQSLARSLVTLLAPAISTVASSLAKLFQSWTRDPSSPEVGAADAQRRKGVSSWLGDPKEFARKFKWMFKDGDQFDKKLEETYPGSLEDRQRADVGSAARAVQADKSAMPAVAEREAYIRQAARARGIDPDTAVAVARSEGLGGAYAGDRKSSFGDFQLHYGGLASGGMAVNGLGDEFTKKTGLDARDKTTWKQQTDFALDEAKKGGWGPWHGWKGMPFHGIGRGGAGAMPPPGDRQSSNNTNSQTVTIGQVTINAPNAKNANDIAEQIPEAIKRQNFAAAANFGQV